MANCHNDCGCPKQPTTCLRVSCDPTYLDSNAYVWLHIPDDCGNETFVPMSYTCLSDAIIGQVVIPEIPEIPEVDLSDYVTTTQLDSSIATLSGTLNAAITQQYNTITSEYTAAIAAALTNYYTRTQVNDLIAGLQNQIDTLTDSLNDLQAQLDACNCDGGTGGTTFNAPTGDWADILSDVCPATTSASVTNPDAVPFQITSTGNGVVSVTVDGSAVTSSFTPADGSTIVITVNGADGENAVGIVNIAYDDGAGNSGNVDGVQYDITCPATGGGGNTAPSITCPADVTLEEDSTATFQVTASDADGDPLQYTIINPVNGVTIDNTTGVGNIADTLAVGTYTVNVGVSDGTETSQCSFDITVTEVAPVNVGWDGFEFVRVRDVSPNTSTTTADAGVFVNSAGVENSAPPNDRVYATDNTTQIGSTGDTISMQMVGGNVVAWKFDVVNDGGNLQAPAAGWGVYTSSPDFVRVLVTNADDTLYESVVRVTVRNAAGDFATQDITLQAQFNDVATGGGGGGGTTPPL